MPLTLQSPALNLGKHRLHRRALLWQITKKGGAVLRFTDHNTRLTYEGNAYLPGGGFNSSAESRETALKEHNREVVGVISSSAITAEDLAAGYYRDAEVLLYEVDWKYPWAGALRIGKFAVGDVKFNGERWDAELVGVGRLLRSRVGATYGPQCRHELGDGTCRVDVPGLTASGVAVTGVTDRRIFAASSLTAADGFYERGKLTWLTGNNAGLDEEVKVYTQTGGAIQLEIPMPNTIQVGDTFDVEPGCDFRYTTCDTRFSNTDNFGGHEFMPQADRTLRSY